MRVELPGGLVVEALDPEHRNFGSLREERQGVMLHYDASRSDAGSLGWFRNPAFAFSYNHIVFDDGSFLEMAPLDKRAYHAGYCRGHRPDLHPGVTYEDANSAFFGLCAAAEPGDTITEEQMATMAALVRLYFQSSGWDLAVDSSRITTHSAEAIYRRGHARAGQLGRKVDPEGPSDHPGYPLFTRDDVIEAL